MDDVAAAIADPVRRAILEMLRDQPLPARRIAGHFEISRPAVSRHLRVLRECGLARDTVTGRERTYRLDPTRLAELTDWLAGFASPAPTSAPAPAVVAAWDQRLDALETEVHRTRRDHRTAGRGHLADRPTQENTA